MKKRTKLLLLTLLTLLFLGASSDMPDSLAAPQAGAMGPEPQKRVVTLTRWVNDDGAEFEQIIQRFNLENQEHIEIKLMNIPESEFQVNLNMQMSSGTGADLLGLKSEYVYFYQNKGWIKNIKNEFDERLLADFPQWAKDYAASYQYDGGFYAIPSTQLTLRLIYNQDLFEQCGLDRNAPPKTLAELIEYSQIISDKNVGNYIYGFAVPMADETSGFVQSVQIPASYSAAGFFDYEKDIFTFSALRPWVDTLILLRSNGGLYPGEAFLKKDTALAQFSEGSIGMMYATSSDPYILKNKYQAKQSWGVGPPPARDADSIATGRLMVTPGVCYAVNEDAADLDAAMVVWEYLHSTQYMERLFATSTEIPVVDSVLKNRGFTSPVKNFELFFPSGEDSAYPITPCEIDSRVNLNAFFIAGANTSGSGGFLAELDKKYNAAYLGSKQEDIFSKKKKYAKSTFDYLNPLA